MYFLYPRNQTYGKNSDCAKRKPSFFCRHVNRSNYGFVRKRGFGFVEFGKLAGKRICLDCSRNSLRNNNRRNLVEKSPDDGNAGTCRFVQRFWRSFFVFGCFDAVSLSKKRRQFYSGFARSYNCNRRSCIYRFACCLGQTERKNDF